MWIQPTTLPQALVGGVPDRFDVPLHLAHEVFHRGEPLLAAESLVDADAHRLVVEIAFEIEHVGLEQQHPGLAVEGGTAPDRQRGDPLDAVARRERASVHAVDRETDALGNGHVRGRKAKIAASLVSVFDDTAHLMWAAED